MPDDRLIHRRSGHGDRSNLLNDLEFRVWIQYILSADDFGVMRFSAVTLQDHNDHLANRPAATVMRCLKAVRERGLIRTFTHQNREYCYQPDWQDWQKIKYPRTTLFPRPPADAIAGCTLKTRLLFDRYPGGNPEKETKTLQEDSEKISETSSQSPDSLTRAGGRETANANAERLPANAERLPANGLPRYDVWLRELQQDYPQQRVTSGHLTEHAFFDALSKHPDGPWVAWGVMRANLENQKRGYEWRVKRMTPKLDNWLRSGAWLQQHDEHPPEAILSEKTTRTLSSAAAFVKGGDR